MNYYRSASIIGVIVLTAIVFMAEQAREETFGDEWGVTPTKVLAAIGHVRTASVSLDDIKQFATLVTHTFLHGGIEHILYNMVFLWVFGVLGCELIGQWRTLAAYFICGIGGGLAQVLMNCELSVPAIGASGAVCGLEGLYLGMALRWDLPNASVWPLAYPVSPMQLVAFAAIGFIGDLLLFGSQGDNTAHGAHIGGLLTGVAVAAVLTTVYPTLSAFRRARHG
jgi:membrane associated rhomboid family serine protease